MLAELSEKFLNMASPVGLVMIQGIVEPTLYCREPVFRSTRACLPRRTLTVDGEGTHLGEPRF